MAKRIYILSLLLVVMLMTLPGHRSAHAGDAPYVFPYEKIKHFLLKETRYVASPHHINGYQDDGKGLVTVYCTRVAVGNEIIGQILYQFILLQTDSGPRWLYLGNVKSQFIN